MSIHHIYNTIQIAYTCRERHRHGKRYIHTHSHTPVTHTQVN